MATVTKKKGSAKKAAPKKAAAKKSTASKAATDSSAPTQTEPALHELFVDEIKDIYWAEKKLVQTLPKMQKAATSGELKNAIGDHLEQTREHVARLEQVFAILGQKAQAKKCDAMEGLTQEGQSIVEDTEAGSATRDVGIIMASQKIEHYEIATYGSLHQLATVLGLSDAAEILATTLEEEKEADSLLSSIAENDINYEASTEE
ncbi:YciE/YciF ferroxidase family protein [Deminuibacter soli]|uniref:Ferritin-like domain-containing protein n=1 Tax=Deminuibacter soli TaxID=2291815 RepID=A0A3E1NFT5_9BACT|nr:ferritin-like domain-containing protein [Deminuibacter soli]RFM26830.1 ferritin-like domain-containing protein [Deminuibacter soli]